MCGHGQDFAVGVWQSVKKKEAWLLSLHRWTINLENKYLPNNFGQGYCHCCSVFTFSYSPYVVSTMSPNPGCSPKPSGTPRRSLHSWTTSLPTNLRVMALGTSRTPCSLAQQPPFLYYSLLDHPRHPSIAR